MKAWEKLLEFRVLLVAISVLITIFIIRLLWGIITIFSDVFLLLFLSWLLAFILEPLVFFLTQRGLARPTAAGLIYLGLAVIAVVFTANVVPIIITQLTVLTTTLPALFAAAPEWAVRIQDFLTNTLINSVTIVESLASAAFSLILVLITSFYFLIDRQKISKFIFSFVPEKYKDDCRFLESVINHTFAGFLRAQLVLGLLLGTTTFLVLLLLRANYLVITSLATAILAVIPVIGPAIAIIPPIIPAIMISLNTGVVAICMLFLAQQIIYNLIAPRLIGQALKIHPLVVLFSFLVGYKIGGVWAAILAVPVVSALAIIGREFIKYWQTQNND